VPDRSKEVLVIAGPTAGGKSALALRLAEALGGAVINADSMQLYAGLPILTAQPSAADRARAPHRLYGALAPEEVGTAASWAAMAEAAIADAERQGLRPILVGGTGLYLRTLWGGIAAVPEIPAAVREAVRARLAAEGAPALHAALAARDAGMAARLKPGDGQRIARALEVVEATGRSLLDFQAETAPAPGGRRYRLIVLTPERAVLGRAIEARVAAMWEAGAAAEAEALLQRALPPDRPILKALGLAPLARALRGEIGFDDAAAATVVATRQYAKRQTTWFTHQCATDRLPTHVHGSHVVSPTSSAQQMESLLRELITILS
jgi:tRNA dimethylallyltransferase